MSLVERLPPGLQHPLQFLEEELAPYPGRLNQLWRVLLASAVVIVISLTLGVPGMGTSLVMVLVVTQSNLLISRLIGFILILMVTLAVGILLLLFKFTFGYPLLRIVIASVFFLGCMFMMRATKRGLAFWLIACAVISFQTYADKTDTPEMLVRSMLWLWVLMIYPIVVSLIINTILLPQEPASQLKKAIHGQLQAVDAHLANLLGKSTAPPPPLTLKAVQKGALTLQALLKMTTMRNKAYRAERARHLATIATVSRLYVATAGLPQPSDVLEPGRLDAIARLRKACAALDSAIASDEPFVLPEPLASNDPELAITPIEEMQLALEALADHDKEPELLPAAPAAPAVKKSIFVDDAFTNPIYVQFALKVLLAVMISWVFYQGADWDEIHTMMLTCVLVAQPGPGASILKSWLRIFGCAIGSLLAVFVTVFVIPYIETVVGVLAFALPVIALAAWIRSGSERISYAGLQLHVTFGLALFVAFGPTVPLSEVSDRALGVFLGVIVFLTIQALIWPESEGKSARGSLASLLEAIGSLLQTSDRQTRSAASLSLAQQQVAILAEFGKCESMLARVALEPSGGESQNEALNVFLQTLLAQTRGVMKAANELQSVLTVNLRYMPGEVRDEIRQLREELAAALNGYANELRGDACQSPAPISLDSLRRSVEEAVTEVPAARTAAILNAMEAVVGQVTRLPSWQESENAPSSLELSPSHV